MSNGQRIILDFLDKYYPGFVNDCDVEFDSESSVILRHREPFKIYRLTINIFCDIMDSRTKEIYAVSDLRHDLDEPRMVPKEWTIKKQVTNNVE